MHPNIDASTNVNQSTNQTNDKTNHTNHTNDKSNGSSAALKYQVQTLTISAGSCSSKSMYL